MCAPSQRLDDNHKRTGTILILVLMVLSSMTALSLGLAYRTRIELRLAQAHAQRAQAHYLALGGIERVKALLAGTELSAQTMPAICAFAATAREEGLFEEVPEFETEVRATLACFVRDELSYFNLNRSDPAAWENLGIFDRGYVAAILDWIDADDDTGPGGAEMDYYSRLPTPYAARNAPCTALKELLLIKDTTREFYLGGIPYRGLLLSAGASEPRSLPPAYEEAAARTGLLDVFTVYGDGKLNINTVAPAILAALPGLDGAVADAVAAWQAGPDGYPGTEDDGSAAAAADLEKIDGLTEQQLELVTEYCCFESQFIRVFSYAGTAGRSDYCLMATIYTGDEEPQVLYVERLL